MSEGGPTGSDGGVGDDAALWRRFAGVHGEEARVTPVYRLKLSGPGPAPASFDLKTFVPADPLRGEALMKDVWRIGNGKRVLKPGGIPWDVPAPSRHFADRLHRFDWLLDLLAQGDEGLNRAELLIDDWIEQFGKFNGFAWRLGPTADRVWHWLLCGRALLNDTPEGKVRLECTARQIRHLKSSLEGSVDHNARWRGACIGLVDAILFKDGEGLDEAIMRMEGEYSAQILPDGGHITRSPERLLLALADVLTLISAFEQTGRPTPPFLLKGPTLMGGMLLLFRSGDGALMPFHDGGECRAETVDAVIEALPTAPRRFSFAMKSGYQRLNKDSLLLVLDSGRSPERPFAGKAHAGSLGFELHDGEDRIVTSCGFSREMNLDWQAAMRRTPAHSTLCIAGKDAAPLKTFEDTRLLTPMGPEGISAKRLEESDEIWLDAQHSGWKEDYGLLHRRRLFMASDGNRLAGEDSLVRPISAGPAERDDPIPFALRFHLHPTVSAFARDDAIYLTCESGQVWRFRTTHERAKLEPSIYLARGLVEKTEQIVMTCMADPNGDGVGPPNCVRWAFIRQR